MTTIRRGAPSVNFQSTTNQSTAAAPKAQAATAKPLDQSVSSFTPAAKSTSSAATAGSEQLAQLNDEEANAELQKHFTKDDKGKSAVDTYMESQGGIYGGMGTSMLTKKMNEFIKANPDASVDEIKTKFQQEQFQAGLLVKMLNDGFNKLKENANMWAEK
jgi:hypothetical protein